MFSSITSGTIHGIESYLIQVEVDVSKGLPCFQMVGLLNSEVKEARKRSGTLITVDMALEQGREVYALPGKISDALSDGCNRLIKQGAAMALSPRELLQEIWELQRRRTGEQGKVNEIQKKILEKMEDTPQSAETIWECFNRGEESLVDISEIMNQLMQLVMEGKIRQTGNSYFSKS